MTHLINKDALVAEIKKRKDEITFLNEFANGTKFGLKTAIDVINTLEVKEVDLEKEWKEFLKDGDVGFKEIAKHFFELGLKAQKGEEV